MQPDHRSRVDAVDAFRGMAILSVAAFHYTYRWGPAAGDAALYDFNLRAFSIGSLGVEFFFIISGFVIFMTIQRCGSAAEFAIRRFVRIYPTYVACMTITFIAMLLFGVELFRSTIGQYLVGFSMQSEHFGVPYVDGVYWTLLIELKFYVWIGLLYFGLQKYFIPAWIVFVLAGIFVLRLSPFWGNDVLIARSMPFFSLGMAFFLQFQNGGRLDLRVLSLAGVAGLGYLIFWRHHEASVHAIVLGMVVLFELAALGKLDWLGRTWLRQVGLISYPLYPLHQFIGVSLIVRMNMVPSLSGWPAVLIGLAAVTVLAWGVHLLVEKPSQAGLLNAVRRMGYIPARG